MAGIGTAILVIIVVIILAVGGLYLLGGGKISGISSGTSKTPILLTDPPNVPPGTSAYVITYSSVQAETSGSGSSASSWTSASGSGSVNLMSLNGSSEVIGYANLNANSTINAVQFQITSAQITINGTTHAVAVPDSTVMANVAGNTKVNQSTSVIIDMSPTVTSTSSSGSANYSMTASVDAVAIVNASIQAQVDAGIGTTINAGTSLINSVGIHT